MPQRAKAGEVTKTEGVARKRADRQKTLWRKMGEKAWKRLRERSDSITLLLGEMIAIKRTKNQKMKSAWLFSLWRSLCKVMSAQEPWAWSQSDNKRFRYKSVMTLLWINCMLSVTWWGLTNQKELNLIVSVNFGWYMVSRSNEVR